MLDALNRCEATPPEVAVAVVAEAAASDIRSTSTK
jgi:hypothetical protein